MKAELLDKIATLGGGAHKPPDGNGPVSACIMEAVAFVAGEPWSDCPECACPVLSAFLRSWNDSLPDGERDALLRPLVLKLVGTRSTPGVEHRRSMMAADWLIRTHTPAWLRLAGLTAQADALAELPEITDMAQVPSIRPAIEAVRRDAGAAWAAARAAAGDAARNATGAAAGAAAGDAAWAAAEDAAWAAAGAAAWAAAWAAAEDAAGAAAQNAAWAAARAKLASTKKELQQSALALVERMIAVRGSE